MVSSTPLDGASGVPTDAPISLDISDFPDPDSVRLDTVLLSSGVYTRLGGFVVDFITRSIQFTPRNPLQADLTYRGDGAAGRSASLTGCTAKSDQRSFQHRRWSGGSAGARARRAGLGARSCRSSPRAAAAATATGPSPTTAAASTRRRRGCRCATATPTPRWSTPMRPSSPGMKRVQPGDASRSYLIRKIVPGPNGGPVPSTPGPPRSARRAARRRATCARSRTGSTAARRAIALAAS